MLEQIGYGYRYTKWIAELRRIKFEYQVQKVMDEMDSIAGEMVEIKNSIIIKDVHLGDSLGANSASRVANPGNISMVGFNEDLMEIKARLCGEALHLQVLPIFGMGGIGKTTLARNAYNDQLIKEHFQIRVWVTISQDCTKRKILLDILDSTKEFDPKRSETPEQSNSEMAERVYKILKGRRYLIIMDDMWSTKVLDDVKNLFPNDKNGSRIMLTTRLAVVAAYANSSIPSHEMRLMDADQSWNLLRQKVFTQQDHIPRELEKIGREIARSCEGLPLAIVVIAGLLSKVSVTLTSWEKIAENVKSSLATTNEQIEKVLSLSYCHLPHHLRPCFLYMGGFPEDHEIKATDLIRLWIAEGFVKPTVSKSLEDCAGEYLEDLVNRSLIVVTKRKYNRKIKCCSLHDMVRDLCIKLSKEEKFLVHITGRRTLELLESMDNQRRISIYRSSLTSFGTVFSSTIRTMMYFHDTLGSFGNFRLLRVLDVLRVGFRSPLLPDQFFELFHLRYLAFCYNGDIPRAISNLQSLQTLIIKGYSSVSLPREIWNMPQLRHLIFFSICHLAEPDGAISALENLRTLKIVHNLTCSISILNMIPNIEKLSLTYYFSFIDIPLRNFVHLRRLEKLKLVLNDQWLRFGDLVVPSSLKKLTLVGWGSGRTYLEIVGPLPNLEVLKLYKFNLGYRGEQKTTDGEFPQLKSLLINDSSLWGSSHFPRLEVLRIYSCGSLSEIPDGIGDIPTLELIELKNCTKSLADSAKRIQEERESYGDDAFQAHCIDCK